MVSKFSNIGSVNNRAELNAARSLRKGANRNPQVEAESVKEQIDIAIETFKAVNGKECDAARANENKVVLDRMLVAGGQRSLGAKLAATLSFGLSNFITGRPGPDLTFDGVLKTSADNSATFFDSTVSESRTTKIGPLAFTGLGAMKTMKLSTDSDGSKTYELSQPAGPYERRQIVKESSRGTLTLLSDVSVLSRAIGHGEVEKKFTFSNMSAV